MLASASLGATPVRQQGQVEGEVLQVFPGVIVIKNEEGYRWCCNSHAHAGERHQLGDKIVAYTTEYRPYN